MALILAVDNAFAAQPHPKKSVGLDRNKANFITLWAVEDLATFCDPLGNEVHSTSRLGYEPGTRVVYPRLTIFCMGECIIYPVNLP